MVIPGSKLQLVTCCSVLSYSYKAEMTDLLYCWLAKQGKILIHIHKAVVCFLIPFVTQNSICRYLFTRYIFTTRFSWVSSEQLTDWHWHNSYMPMMSSFSVPLKPWGFYVILHNYLRTIIVSMSHSLIHWDQNQSFYFFSSALTVCCHPVAHVSLINVMGHFCSITTHYSLFVCYCLAFLGHFWFI